MDRPFIELRVGVVRAFDDNQLRAHALPAQGGVEAPALGEADALVRVAVHDQEPCMIRNGGLSGLAYLDKRAWSAASGRSVAT